MHYIDMAAGERSGSVVWFTHSAQKLGTARGVALWTAGRWVSGIPIFSSWKVTCFFHLHIYLNINALFRLHLKLGSLNTNVLFRLHLKLGSLQREAWKGKYSNVHRLDYKISSLWFPCQYLSLQYDNLHLNDAVPLLHQNLRWNREVPSMLCNVYLF